MAAPIVAVSLLAACGSTADTASLEPTGGALPATRGNGVLPPTPTTVPLFADTGFADPLDTVPDPRLAGIIGWINSPALDLASLEADDRVVLLDFWTYTCVNCVRTYPFLKTMHARYAPHGLTLIGVHSPEFEFEKDPANVRLAVESAGLDYPIAIDSDKQTWDAFGNHFWPTSYLLGADGEVLYRHFGEGGYEVTEARIRQALEEAGADLSAVTPGGEFKPPVVENAHTQTRELYAGYTRGYESAGLFAAQDAYYLGPDNVADYADAGLRRHGQFELDGEWLNQADAIVSGPRRVEAAWQGGYIVFPFLAASVNAVMSPGDSAATVIVELDGGPVPDSHAGHDIAYDDAGRSFITVDQPRMYRVIETDEFRLYELKLMVETPGMGIHNFTFGVFTEGP